MDFHETESMARINRMVDNFRKLCCCEQCVETSNYSTSPRAYTNFSVRQILKQEFGRSQYDSDGTYVSENSDVYSSCDEYEICSSPDLHESRSSEPLDLSHKCTRHDDDDIEMFKTLPKSSRVGFQADEDGYSSSDSEFAHAPLDLRVQRKKTPPKVTSGIPAWVFCTRYSDRPTAGPRARRRRQGVRQPRTRTAFNDFQLEQLNLEFTNDQYLSESRRLRLANDLNLNEANVKIWFQNKRAKLKKIGDPRPLARQLQSEGLYNHKLST